MPEGLSITAPKVLDTTSGYAEKGFKIKIAKLTELPPAEVLVLHRNA